MENEIKYIEIPLRGFGFREALSSAVTHELWSSCFVKKQIKVNNNIN